MYSKISLRHSTMSGQVRRLTRSFFQCREGGTAPDVAATPSNAKCERFFDVRDDGLVQSWAREIVWMNPPYGRGVIDRWIDKAIRASALGATVVALVPNRPDTRWYRACIEHASEVRHIEGRLRFGDATDPAPFPSAIFVFRPLPWLKHAANHPDSRFVASKHRKRERTRFYTVQLRPLIDHDA